MGEFFIYYVNCTSNKAVVKQENINKPGLLREMASLGPGNIQDKLCVRNQASYGILMRSVRGMREATLGQKMGQFEH